MKSLLGAANLGRGQAAGEHGEKNQSWQRLQAGLQEASGKHRALSDAYTKAWDAHQGEYDKGVDALKQELRELRELKMAALKETHFAAVTVEHTGW